LIDLEFGLSALNSYLTDLALLKSGVSFAELGYSEKRASQKPVSRGNIAMLQLNGVMRLEDGISTRGVRSLIADIESANLNSMVRGILLEINSGGGEAVAGGVLHDAIKSSSKPIVSYGHFVGSAAYMAAIASDELVLSNNMAKAGSIGAMITVDKKLFENYKDSYMSIYAQQSPDKNKELRSALEGDFSFVQMSVDQAAQIFQNTVLEYRKIKDKEKALSGGMFYAEEAKGLGLIDGIGGIEYALRRLHSHIKLNSI
jgi:protease-4